MARQVLVVALVFFAIFSYACAETAKAPVPDGDENPAANAIPSMAPSSDDHIGNDDDGDNNTAAAANGPSSNDVVEGPIGGAGLDSLTPGASHSESSASSLQLSAFAGLAVAAGYFF
ncbi:uncharacterized protein LOC107428433 [Ziziphus jujuba]|uniref:Uncharacterized protein LOC107428433 n=2 Tax=Ziziphus jujuba TaxID=326968 RepID=A0A6P4B6Z9_ZIZJJ|nr:uncharacterized protein LOC107428433 [Ziziphus jujuba]KAH7515624.1 hypothetical protein FEM48_Zijuj10G0046200 [Ziziphus jujuba var. spinosa]